MPPEGIERELALGGHAEAEAVLLDRSTALPAPARRLVDARPETAVAQHGGDAWITTRRMRF